MRRRCEGTRVVSLLARLRIGGFGILVAFGGVGGIPVPAGAQSDTVEVWIRAFIPNPANAGRSQGFILPRPGEATGSFVKVDVPLLGTQCFLTDHRGFNSGPASTARLETRMSLRLAGGQGTAFPSTGRTSAGTTAAVDCATGALRVQAPGRVIHDHLGHPAVADGVVQVIGQVTGTNVLAAHGIGPSIDYSFDLQWKPSTRTLTARVTYGAFPAFEMYARRPTGTWMSVVTSRPSSTPWGLTGDVWGTGVERRGVSVSIP